MNSTRTTNAQRKVVGNQISTASTKTKRRRAKMKTTAPSVRAVTPLPKIYRVIGDSMALRLRTSTNIVNTGTGIGSYILSLFIGNIGTAQYLGLGNIFPMLPGMGTQYAHFMVSHLKVQLVPTSPATSGGYVALSFEPDDTATSGPPSTLQDVSSAVHSDVAQVTEIAGIELNPSDYYNDWRSTTTPGASNQGSTAGVVQVWCSNNSASGVGVAILQIELDIHFSGFRYA